jgi:type IV pilus assembly protein PilF
MKKTLILGCSALFLGGCGLFSSNATLTQNQQIAAYIRHEHNAGSGSKNLKEPANSAKTKAHIYTALGTVYLQAGHPRKALRELKLAVTKAYRSPAALDTIGLAYEQIQQYKLADNAFRRAIVIVGNNPEYRNNYGAFLISVKHYHKAVYQLKKAVADPMYSTPQFAWTNLARAYAGLNMLPDERKALHHALYLVPNYPPVLQMLAEIDFKAGNVKAAYDKIQIVLAQEPNNSAALLLAGKIAAQNGNNKLADHLLKRCVDSSPFSVYGREAQRLLVQH